MSDQQQWTLDDLLRCLVEHEQCDHCRWAPVVETTCEGLCIGSQRICPWLMVCRCLNPRREERVGRRLEGLARETPPDVQLAPVSVPRSRLRTERYEIRQNRDSKLIVKIADSIQRDGLYAPPGCVAAEDGLLDVVMGTNRLLAMLSLDWKFIPVRVFQRWGESYWDRLAKALGENTLRQEMSFVEEVAVVYRYWQEAHATVRATAAHFGRSVGWAHERIAWGQRIYESPKTEGDREPASPPAVPAADEIRQARRAARRRVAFREEDIQEWLGLLQPLVHLNGDHADDPQAVWRAAMQRLQGKQRWLRLAAEMEHWWREQHGEGQEKEAV